ncbi:MAG: T9SS type A sorting domain-containing protein, partial [Bacteroidales bacterium]|nr:T9SS type A sorting domain-containing protein [Bacteroidales bacterium]
GFYGEGDSVGTLNDFVNFQVWIYEGFNDIEFHYGPSSIADMGIAFEDQPGPLVGTADENLVDAYLLSGDPTSPTLIDSVGFLNPVPASGTVYRFVKKTMSISTPQKTSIYAQMIPNPVHQSSILRITNYSPQNAQLYITDVQGREVKVINNIHTSEIIIERAKLSSGVYFYQLIDDDKAITRGKFIVE